MPILAQTTPEVDLSDALVGTPLTAVDWIIAGSVFAGSILLSRVVKRLVRGLMARFGAVGAGGDALARLSGYLVILVGLVYALSELGVRVGPLLGALGIGGLVLALAVQGTLENVVAGFLLQARREFRRGDQIVTQDLIGTVEDIDMRTTVLRALSGERHIIPNSAVMNAPITVLTDRPIRRSSMVVGVEYRTDLPRAQAVILEAVNGVDEVAANPTPEALIARFAESSIEFEVRYWHGSRDADRFRATGEVALAIKDAFNRTGITIAFPQRVLWANEPLRVARDGGA